MTCAFGKAVAGIAKALSRGAPTIRSRRAPPWRASSWPTEGSVTCQHVTKEVVGGCFGCQIAALFTAARRQSCAAFLEAMAT